MWTTKTMLGVAVAGLTLLLTAGCGGPSAEQRALQDKDLTIKKYREDIQAAKQREDEQNTQLAETNKLNGDLARQMETVITKDSVVNAETAKKVGDLQAQIAELDKKLNAGQKDPNATVHNGGGGNIVIRVANTTLFDPGKADLKSSAHPMLEKVMHTIKAQYPNNFLRVEGHTDSTPVVHSKDKFADNMVLSMARAKAVYDFLVKTGVPANKMYVAGYGAKQPLVTPEKTAADRAKNRRVDIVILPNVQVERQTVATTKK